MKDDLVIGAVFSQEVGGMLEGGNDLLSEKLQHGASAFTWQRSGSFLCGIRSAHDLFTSTSKEVSVHHHPKMAGRYMQKVALTDQNWCFVASFVNLHALQGNRNKGRTTTDKETVLHLESAKANLSPAPVKVILGDINQSKAWVKRHLGDGWEVEGNDHGDFIAIKGSSNSNRFSLEGRGLSADHLNVFGVQVELPMTPPLTSSSSLPFCSDWVWIQNARVVAAKRYLHQETGRFWIQFAESGMMQQQDDWFYEDHPGAWHLCKDPLTQHLWWWHQDGRCFWATCPSVRMRQ